MAFLRHLHNPYLSNQIHMMSARLIYNMVEMVIQKDTQQAASKLLTVLFEGCVDKVESMALVLEEVLAKIGKSSNKADIKADVNTEVKSEAMESKVDAVEGKISLSTSNKGADIALVEKARPIASATYAVEKPEELILGVSNTCLNRCSNSQDLVQSTGRCYVICNTR